MQDKINSFPPLKEIDLLLEKKERGPLGITGYVDRYMLSCDPLFSVSRSRSNILAVFPGLFIGVNLLTLFIEPLLSRQVYARYGLARSTDMKMMWRDFRDLLKEKESIDKKIIDTEEVITECRLLDALESWTSLSKGEDRDAQLPSLQSLEKDLNSIRKFLFHQERYYRSRLDAAKSPVVDNAPVSRKVPEPIANPVAPKEIFNGHSLAAERVKKTANDAVPVAKPMDLASKQSPSKKMVEEKPVQLGLFSSDQSSLQMLLTRQKLQVSFSIPNRALQKRDRPAPITPHLLKLITCYCRNKTKTSAQPVKSLLCCTRKHAWKMQ